MRDLIGACRTLGFSVVDEDMKKSARSLVQDLEGFRRVFSEVDDFPSPEGLNRGVAHL